MKIATEKAQQAWLKDGLGNEWRTAMTRPGICSCKLNYWVLVVWLSRVMKPLS